jgi:two-component system NtrC family sensor kinase
VTSGWRIAPWRRLWFRLALLGTLGVVATHTVHLVVANRTVGRALTRQILDDGDVVASMLARECAQPLLTADQVALQELVDRTAAARNIAYCFVQRGPEVLASSFKDGTPTALLGLTRQERAVLVRLGRMPVLDLEAPILRGSGGTLRLGLHLKNLAPPRRHMAMVLGTIAVAVIFFGILAALIVGRQIARPVAQMADALRNLDPTRRPKRLPRYGSDEIGFLGRRVDEMRKRLHAAHLEREQARRSQMQTEKLAALGTLVAGMAHELNNPLAGVMNCHEWLCKDEGNEAKRRQYLELMAEGLARIESAVARLLGFARPRTLEKEPVVIGELLATVHALVLPVLGTRNQSLELDPGDLNEHPVSLDRNQVCQALVNLVLNGAYVTAEGGTLELTAARSDRRLRLDVKDQGPGVPLELRNQIENPFFTTKPEGEGTGLGLSVTRSIAEAHGGDLAFSFPERGGTVATLWVPFEVGGAQAEPASEG